MSRGARQPQRNLNLPKAGFSRAEIVGSAGHRTRSQFSRWRTQVLAKVEKGESIPPQFPDLTKDLTRDDDRALFDLPPLTIQGSGS
jgi:hypothetical protein